MKALRKTSQYTLAISDVGVQPNELNLRERHHMPVKPAQNLWMKSNQW